jgi:UDP-N-acetylglucosamine--N-acetylmuramyl-(pentapeptide) pyrophosphoryl-undecaprenol N-acetylglucosamine transferase
MSRLPAKKTLLFAGGGTGGHVFPMIAVAEAVRTLAPDVRAVFVGTARGLEARAVPERGYELELMRILPLRGGGVAGFVRGAWRAAGSLPEARDLVKRLRPAAVLSVGGYAAGPVALAGWSLGVPLALLEPNSVMGMTNRLVAPLAQRGYVAFEAAARHFRRGRVQRLGVPLRPGFQPVPYAAGGGALKLLVLGGSQGAKALNEAVPHAVARLGTAVEVVHQCGPAHALAVTTLYKQLGLAERARVIPFIDDMPAALAASDLVVGRAGAGALSEICAVGRPSLLVPYPFAADDHQRVNAEALAAAGAAVCVRNADATPERLATEVERLAGDRSQLVRMARRAQELGRPDAAQRIARDLLSLAGLSDGFRVPGGSAAAAEIPPSAAGFSAREAV